MITLKCRTKPGSVISIYETLGDEARRIFPDSNHFVLRNCVDDSINLVSKEHSENIIYEKSHLRRRKLNLGYLGRLSKEKCPFSMLKILSNLSKHLDFNFIFIGDSSWGFPFKERDRFLNMVTNLGLSGRFYMTGIVDEVGQYLPAVDLLVLPSSTEGVPVSILEGLYSGIPCVASRVGGIPTIIKDGYNGILVDIKTTTPYKIKSELEPGEINAFVDATRWAAENIQHLKSNSSLSKEHSFDTYKNNILRIFDAIKV